VEDNAYLFEVTAGALYVLVGVPLWQLARRSGDVAARLIGVTFLLWGFSYLLYNIPLVLADERLLTPFFFGGRVAYDLGALTMAVFTWKVFRSNERWALGLVLATGVCLGFGIVGSAAVGDWEGVYPLTNPWFWLEWLGMCLPLAWVGCEGLLEHVQARRRAVFGLCEPIVANRFLLWGLVGVFMLSSNFAMLPQYIEYEQEAQFSAAMDALVGLTEIFTIGVIALVFFPPRWYRRWVENGANSAMASDAG
jgi:hypothetical protein